MDMQMNSLPATLSVCFDYISTFNLSITVSVALQRRLCNRLSQDLDTSLSGKSSHLVPIPPRPELTQTWDVHTEWDVHSDVQCQNTDMRCPFRKTSLSSFAMTNLQRIGRKYYQKNNKINNKKILCPGREVTAAMLFCLLHVVWMMGLTIMLLLRV